MRPLTEQGFGYLTVLFLVLAMSVTLGVATENLDTALRRDKEKDWIFIGNQYQQAISSYYHQSPNGLKVLPESMALLLSDERTIDKKHHLRKPFLDPVTNRPWQLILNGQQRIVGVRSTSDKQFQMSHSQLSKLLGKKIENNIRKYSDLKFEYQPSSENENGMSTIVNLPSGIQQPN